jgi:hypothetical protein
VPLTPSAATDAASRIITVATKTPSVAASFLLIGWRRNQFAGPAKPVHVFFGIGAVSIAPSRLKCDPDVLSTGEKAQR